MWQLVLIDIALIIVGVGLLFLSKKLFKSEKQIKILFIILPLLTIACHYSSLLYHFLKDGSQLLFLTQNPNLILPIYPCNVIMWGLLIVGIFYDKQNKFMTILKDFCFYFGIISALIGMFANVDFINNPTLSDYDVTKGIVAHGFMLMNIMALGFYKSVKVDLHSNFVHLVIGVLGMGVIGLYNNLLITILSGEAYAKVVNSMFLLGSPFEGADWVTYPVVVAIALPVYFGIFEILDLVFYEKGNRWIHREKHW